MRLTPITKKRSQAVARQGEETAVATKRRRTEVASGDHHGRPDGTATQRGRRAKPASPTHLDESAAANGSASRPKQPQRMPKKRRRLGLLGMPGEIMEIIFSYERNVNLPLSDPRIGVLLSSPYVLRCTVLDVFDPTWENWFGIPRYKVRSYHGWNSDGARFGGNPLQQSAVLRQKWMSFEMLINVQERWLSKQPQALRKLVAPNLSSKLRESAGPDGTCQREEEIGNLSMEAQIRGEFASLLQMQWRPVSIHSSFFVHMLDINPHAEIPDRLLTGPWSRDDLMLLFWLLRSGAKLSPKQSWELISDGLTRIAATIEMARPLLDWTVSPGETQADDVGVAVDVFCLFCSFHLYSLVPRHPGLNQALPAERALEAVQAFQGPNWTPKVLSRMELKTLPKRHTRR